MHGPKINARLDIHRLKIGVPSLDIHGPKIDAGIDIKNKRLIFFGIG